VVEVEVEENEVWWRKVETENVNKKVTKKGKEIMARDEGVGDEKVKKGVKWKGKKRKMARTGRGGRRLKVSKEGLEIVIWHLSVWQVRWSGEKDKEEDERETEDEEEGSHWTLDKGLKMIEE
jgi:hypothetical protein